MHAVTDALRATVREVYRRSTISTRRDSHTLHLISTETLRQGVWGVRIRSVRPQQLRCETVHLIDHVLELSLGGVLAQRAHDSPQLLGGDGTVAILVEEGESLLELSDLLLRQLICAAFPSKIASCNQGG